MSDINVNNDYTKMNNLSPFKLCVIQNFPFIEADFDAVTNYQLLCKVVEYLNNVIDNNNKQNTNITQLEQNFITLYNYVKDYFDNLDVQEEINNKLDSMASDGSLSNLIQPLFDEYKTTIDSEVNSQNDKIIVLENRMDTFTSLPSGSTSGNAELIDIRVPANGFNNNNVYSTAGNAVRGQVTELKGDLVKLDNVVGVTEKKQGFLNSSGEIKTTTDNYYYAEFFNVKQNDKFIYSGSWGAWGVVFGYKADGTSVQLLSAGTYNDKEIIIESTDIITIRAWSNYNVAELKLEKLNSLFFDVEENKTKIENIELDVDWLNSICQYYQESEINSSDYDKNSKIIKFREILPVGSNIRIKIIAESFGYISAVVRSGGTETSIRINSTIVNIGDVISVNGVSDTDISDIYIYSPNSVKCKVFILSTNKPKNEIIVDANGYGDYRSLDDAIDNANDSKEMPVVIRVRPGTYYTRTETPSDIPYVKKNRYISIIGDSKDSCIIRNDNGYYSPFTEDSYGMLYDSTPIRLSGMVTIENLTIISTKLKFESWVSDHSTEVKGNDGANSYCIHIDFDAPENTAALVKNCILINDHYSCIGAGNRKNYTIKIEDCELTSTIDERVSSPDNGSTIFVHSYNLNSGNAYDGQNIFIKNNIIKNINKHNACYFYASAPDRMYCTLIGNVCKTSDNSQAFVSIGNAYGITKTDLCFGNNVNSMN